MYIENSNDIASFIIWADEGRCGICLTPTGEAPNEIETDGDLALAISMARQVIARQAWRWATPEGGALLDLMLWTADQAEHASPQ